MKYPVNNLALRSLPIFGLFCFLFLKVFSQTSATEQYIRKYSAIAEEEMQRTGVPAAISLAQGIIESQSGTGWLVEHSNNHFGIKCKNGWTGQSIRYDDDHRNECFRVYHTDDSSWRDHSDFLKNSTRYAFLFYLNPMDYKAWAYGLKEAGYATNKQYAKKLIQTIETYHLQQYSEQAAAGIKSSSQHDFAVMLNKKVDEDRKAMEITEPKPVIKKDTLASPYPPGVFRINDRRVLYLPGGTQLISIAEKYHVRLSKLLNYNELQSDVLEKDMLIYTEKKGKTGVHETHMVADGETLHQIAQEEGIRLKWLCRRNRMDESDGSAGGTLLYLSQYAPESAPVAGNEPEQAGNTAGKGFWYKLTHLFSVHRKAAADQRSTDSHPLLQVANYEVKRGDTLYSISKKYDVTVAQIQAWNHLEGNAIREGQKLIIKSK